MKTLFCFWVIIAWPVYGKVIAYDDLGDEVVLETPATRIVSLAPHLTEILFSLGVGMKIVGTVRYADYPEQAKQIPRLGDAFSLNVESVLALRPDLILAWHTGGINRPIRRLKEFGIPVYVNESTTLNSIADGIVQISTLVGAESAGKILQKTFVGSLSRLRRDVDGGPAIFFQISDHDLYTLNGEHLIGQAIRLCGGRNLFPDLQPQVTLVSKEAVVLAAPDLILITQHASAVPSPWIERWQQYDVFKGRVVTIDPNLISRPGFRMLEGIKSLCDVISRVK